MVNTKKTTDICGTCYDRERRGYEVKSCDTGYGCPFIHLGYLDPVETGAASMRAGLRTRGIVE